MGYDDGKIVTLRIADLTWQEIDGEVVALDLRTSTYLSVNGAGALLWKALADGATPEMLAALLRSTYGIDEQRARDDAAAFLASMRDRDLLT